MSEVSEAIPKILPILFSTDFFSGKIRIRLLMKLFLNPGNQVYLRGLQRDLGVSSNTVRLELNKLAEMRLIKIQSAANSKVKLYVVNLEHPLYQTLRNIILTYVGVDQITELIIHKLGNVEKVFLTGDLAQGRNSQLVDLVIVGNIDRLYLYTLIEKVEKLIEKKIRVGLFSPEEFTNDCINDIGASVNLMDA